MGELLRGHLHLGEPRAAGHLYRLRPDGAVAEIIGDVGLSNGLDWSDDRKAFYFADSAAGEWTCSTLTPIPAR